MRNGISAVLIARNEAATVGRCLKALEELDEVVLLDTGSEDGTPDIAAGLGARVFHRAVQDPFHFGQARNEAKDKARNPWILSIDCDEVLHPGSVAEMRRMISSRPFDLYNVRFLMRVGPDDPVVETKRPMLFSRTKFVWMGRIHELPMFVGNRNPLMFDLRDAVAEHFPVGDKAGRVAQNRKLLEISLAEGDKNLRLNWIQGMELAAQERWSEAVPFLEKWSKVCDEGDLMRSEVLIHLGRCRARAGDVDAAMKEFDAALEICPVRREAHLQAAIELIRVARLPEAKDRLEALLAIPVDKMPQFYLNDRSAWSTLPTEMLADLLAGRISG